MPISTVLMLDLPLEQMILMYANSLDTMQMVYQFMDSAKIAVVRFMFFFSVYFAFLLGTTFTSCYQMNSDATTSTVVTASGTYTIPSYDYDYTFTSDSSCNLDEANGL